MSTGNVPSAMYYGARTSAELATINTGIANKSLPFDPGSTVLVDGVTYYSVKTQGAQFTTGLVGDSPIYVDNPSGVLVDGAGNSVGASVVVQAARVAPFNLAASDNGAVIPCGATLAATLLAAAGLDVNFMCELRNVAAVATTLTAGAGATLIVGGASVGSVAIANEGSSIVVLGSGTANRFYASKVGA